MIWNFPPLTYKVNNKENTHQVQEWIVDGEK
jgi:hypothetical protein